MKFGVKTYDSFEFLKHFENSCDFFEVQAIQKNNYSFLRKFKIPIVIHAEHKKEKINPANISKKKSNLKSLKFAIKTANFCNSKKIIYHPGYIEKDNCSEKNAIDFVKNIKDSRILIENMPNPKKCFCSTPEEMKFFIKETGKGFCLDINHAIISAVYLKQDYISMIKDFLKLKPKHYHLGGHKLFFNKFNISHLALSKTNFDLRPIFEILPRNAEITLETNTNIKDIEQDLVIARKLSSLL